MIYRQQEPVGRTRAPFGGHLHFLGWTRGHAPLLQLRQRWQLIEFWEFFIQPGYVLYQTCGLQIFLSACILSFYFLNSVFEEDKFLILIKSNSLTDHAFGVVSRKSLLNSRPLFFREEIWALETDSSQFSQLHYCRAMSRSHLFYVASKERLPGLGLSYTSFQVFQVTDFVTPPFPH